MSERIPADTKRCQVEKYNPFILGGSVYQRCNNVPNFIIYETVPGDDGAMGSQSVCAACREEWAKKTGNPNVDNTWRWEPINEP